ncbi:hypothetical protein QCA50_008389 [Cerrena zonata]|uniref:Protein ZIP4 homolog n=1 Tax=Cerrena zonata TaxID=2478898 RepID=A0AAW0G8T9_9APHY
MSAHKRKNPQNVQSLFNTIQDILISIKPKLAEHPLPDSTSLVNELRKIASLAESSAQFRSRANKDWLPLADVLDREGVHLWNLSGQLPRESDDDVPPLFAALRLAGFRLIEAGLVSKPPIETLIHVLQLASKAAASLLEIGRNDEAASVLTCAAKYEEDLKIIDDAKGSHQQAKSRAVVMYYVSRIEAAWSEGNSGIMDFMLQKILGNEQQLSLLSSQDRFRVASKLLEIGKSSLRAAQNDVSPQESTRSSESVKWLQSAFSIIERSDDSELAGVAVLKRSILRSLARAYFVSSADNPDHLNRAEATLNELISSLDASFDRWSPEYQQLRWMRIAILKRRKAAESPLLEAFKSIIDHMSYSSEENITDILQELRTLSHYHDLVTAVHHHALQTGLDAERNPDFLHIDRILLSLVFHCSRQTHQRAMRDIGATLKMLSEADFKLSKVPVMACLSLLWQFGDRQYTGKHWSEAADWFLTGTHSVFDGLPASSKAKCCRKAALCYIHQQDYAKVSAVLQRCDHDEAATHYVMLLTAVKQGLEDEAIRATRAMARCPDFDRNMLLLATQLAHESDMKTLLLSILEELLQTVNMRVNDEFQSEALTLIRCIIRLVVKLLGEPGAKRQFLVSTLLKHFHAAITLIDSMRTQGRAIAVTKDISWLWRTAYNCAVQGCSEWENTEDEVADLFDIARLLLTDYSDLLLTDLDPAAFVHLVNAFFASVAGKVFAIRPRLHATGSISAGEVQALVERIISCKDCIRQVLADKKLTNAEDVQRAHAFIYILHVFDAEVFCAQKKWTSLLRTIEEATQSEASALDTLEAIADLVWAEKDCPTEVLFAALEAILHASLDRLSFSVSKFSRWLRAICTIMLSRNTPTDRTKSFGYVEQAVAVIEEHSAAGDENDIYPVDERLWLLGTAYNTGIECLHASQIDEAKRWFESCTIICRHVPNGEAHAEKISDTYTQLLAHYAPGNPTSNRIVPVVPL